MSTIVVIEEDTAMRTLICEWLEAAGYRVQGWSARALTAAAAGIDLVVVDLPNLPMQGAATVQQVHANYPGARVIGLSTQLSRTLAADSELTRALGIGGLVTKPCTRDELLMMVVSRIGVAH